MKMGLKEIGCEDLKWINWLSERQVVGYCESGSHNTRVISLPPERQHVSQNRYRPVGLPIM